MPLQGTIIERLRLVAKARYKRSPLAKLRAHRTLVRYHEALRVHAAMTTPAMRRRMYRVARQIKQADPQATPEQQAERMTRALKLRRRCLV